VTDLLVVDRVSKSFGGLRAVSECSLTVAEGTITGLIGPNGSGKTTLFNVLTGYVKSDSGDMWFRGRPFRCSKPEDAFRLGIGRTFQLTRIFPRVTVLENMLIATQRHEGWLRSMLRSPGSRTEKDRAMSLLAFVGLERLAGDLAGTLSYGQRKLLELAYVLVADPSVVLLDEPAGGVNPTLIEEIASRITELNQQGKTFLIVEHNLEFVMKLCQEVTVMESGQNIASGPPEAVRKDPRVLEAYLGRARGVANGQRS
jgi:ABC-type branched-subunit amino acid transport system ATPase component